MRRSLWFYGFALLLAGSCGPGLGTKPENSAAGGITSDSPLRFIDLMPSMIHRENEVSQITLAQERMLGADIPTDYDPDAADDLLVITPSDYAARQASYIGQVAPDNAQACGNAGAVAERINDCEGKLLSTWSGASMGKSGEGNWTLVSRKTVPLSEVWRDDRTMLIWSDESAIVADWNTGVASCADQNIMEDAKGNFSPGEVYWRLPTVNDVRLALINGLRWVFHNGNWASSAYWTKSIEPISGDPFLFFPDQTIWTELSSASTNSVRCVGRYAQ
jgi:hypothetical protein